MIVRMLDLVAENAALNERMLPTIQRTLESGRFILGPEVERFERAAAEYLGAAHGVGVSSGSDALVVALQALGIGEGDEVLTTPFSFFATVESIVRVGARPRFADVHPDTLQLDPRAINTAITSKTRAVLAVHLYGCPVHAEALRVLADAHDVALVEDAAQAFGARLRGKAAGTFGTIGCFSFQPSKPLGAYGDAGLVVTDDPEMAERARRIRVHGASQKHHHLELGGNYRLDALQAAVLAEKLPHFPGWLQRRAEHAAAYTRDLSGLDGLVTPSARPDVESSWALYTVRVTGERRAALRDFLAGRGIETAVHYPVPLHLQPAMVSRQLGLPAGSLPIAERAAREVLSLPVHPWLSAEQHAHVVASVREFFEA